MLPHPLLIRSVTRSPPLSPSAPHADPSATRRVPVHFGEEKVQFDPRRPSDVKEQRDSPTGGPVLLRALIKNAHKGVETRGKSGHSVSSVLNVSILYRMCPFCSYVSLLSQCVHFGSDRAAMQPAVQTITSRRRGACLLLQTLVKCCFTLCSICPYSGVGLYMLKGGVYYLIWFNVSDCSWTRPVCGAPLLNGSLQNDQS